MKLNHYLYGKQCKQMLLHENHSSQPKVPKKNVSTEVDVEVILREHDSLRTEIMERMRNQNNYMIIAVTILSSLLGYLSHLYEIWMAQKINPVIPQLLPNTDFRLFLTEPIPKALIITGSFVLNSIAALFILNDKNKTLTVLYIYNYLAPRLNKLTNKTMPEDEHFHWRDYRTNRRKSFLSKISNGILFSSHYVFTLIAPMALLLLLMISVDAYIGILNQPLTYLVVESLSAMYSLILLIVAIKTFCDKTYASKPFQERY